MDKKGYLHGVRSARGIYTLDIT